MALSKPAKQFTDDDLIQCGICHVDIDDPRSLLCLHTYCLKCLREWNKTSTSKDEVICPICRELTPLPASGVAGLRCNFLVKKLKDRKSLSRQLMDKDVKIVCTDCDVSEGRPAVARCLECDDFLCSNCMKAHKSVRVTRNHTVLSLVELRSGKVSLIKKNSEEHCKEHTGQVLWFYCKTCDIPICRDCSVVQHPTGSHKLVKLEEATAERRREIEGLVSECQPVKKMVDKSFQNIQQMQVDLDSTRKSVIAAIDGQGESVKKALADMVDKQVDDLKASVTGMVSAREKLTTTHKDELQLLNSRLNTALEIGSKVITDGSDCDVASAYKPLTTTLKQLRGSSVSFIDLGGITFAKQTSTWAAPHIGSLEEKKTTTSTKMVPVRLRNKESWNATWKMVKKFGDAGEGKLKDARGVATNQDGDISVVDWNAKKVYVYGFDDGKMKMAIDTTKSLHSSPGLGSYPHGVAVYNGEYIVADNTYYPTIYDSRGNYVRPRVRQIPIANSSARCIAGIARDRRGNILVERPPLQLSIHSYADSAVKAILKVPFNPKYIAVASDDNRIIISANSSKGAQVIDSKGTTIHVLRPSTDVTSQWYPSGVTVGEGEEEEVFIANREGKKGIYRFSLATGKYIGCVTTHVADPRGISFTEDERLVVADRSCVKVFAPADQ